MKIIIVSNYTLNNQQSMLKYSDLLSDGLRFAGYECVEMSPYPLFGELPSTSGGLRKWLGYIVPDRKCYFIL
jgi:hypothetical protein